MKPILTALILMGTVHQARALPIVAGDDFFASTADFTLEIFDPFFPGGFIENLMLSSTTPAIVHRDAQVGMTIDTEIISLDLVGTSSFVGPLAVRVGSGNAIPVQESPTFGQITDVVQNPLDPGFATGDPSSFVSGDSFFDVFFEIDVGGMTFYNKDPKTLGPETIHSLPPYLTTYSPPGSIPLYLRVGPLNDPGDPLVGSVLGTHTVTPEASTSLPLLLLGAFAAWIRRRRS